MTLRDSIAGLLCIALIGCGGERPAPEASPPDSGKPVIAAIPKGTTHIFWKTVEEGARAGAAASDVELIWKGPLKENDRAQQIQLMQQFISQGVSGIALAPLDRAALVGPVAQAKQAGIPVVIFDSALDGTPGQDFVALVSTNNLEGGRMAGRHMAGLLSAGGEVVLLRYQVGSASTEAREEGFAEMARAGGLKISSDNRHAGATVGEAQTESLKLIDQLRAADGVYCPNESSTMGMLLALRQSGLAGKIRFVGFDASPPLVEALRAGEIDALVLQRPRAMGRLAVERLAAHLRGEPIEASIDTGAVVATRDNMDEPEVATLLQ
jgi:ribose transport system substrate-binding protein